VSPIQLGDVAEVRQLWIAGGQYHCSMPVIVGAPGQFTVEDLHDSRIQAAVAGTERANA
jgi:hypothetical protein